MVDRVFAISDCPAGLDLGIDCFQFETGPRFLGLSHVPQGLHFVYYSCGQGPREGFFVTSSALEVRAWDSQLEQLPPSCSLTEAQLMQFEKQLQSGALSGELGTYPVEQYSTWLNLTLFISAKVLFRARVQEGVLISSSEGGDVPRFCDLDSSENRLVVQTNAKLVSSSPIERASTLTALGMDKSVLLEDVASSYFEGDLSCLLGELQLSFILFVLLFSFESLEQWKRMVTVICHSRTMLLRDETLAVRFIRVLFEQLIFAPNDLFSSELSRDNFLCPALGSLFSILLDSRSSELLESTKRLLAFVQRKFDLFNDLSLDGGMTASADGGCDFDAQLDLQDEDRPVVVEIQESDELGVSDRSFDDRHEEDVDAGNVKRRWEQINALLPAPRPLESLPPMVPTEHAFLASTVDQIEAEVTGPPLSFVERSNTLYSWRYPLLFDEMTASNGLEDLLMTAVRVLEGGQSHYKEALLSEAKNYIEFEAQLFSDSSAR